MAEKFNANFGSPVPFYSLQFGHYARHNDREDYRDINCPLHGMPKTPTGNLSDEGHIALKLLGMYRTVNITLGLPIIRTSAAHGTAFDKAWQGIADSGSLIEAVKVAVKLSTKTVQ